MDDTKFSPDVVRILEARHHDPFSVLGRHKNAAGKTVVRAFIPGAQQVSIADTGIKLKRLPGTNLFEWQGKKKIPEHYQLEWQDEHGQVYSHYDPYCFTPVLSDFDLHLFGEGNHWHAYRFLGAHSHTHNGISGTVFATWAPSAERVSVVGDFNNWDGRCHPMRARGNSGVWELFIPNIEAGAFYKLEIRNRDSGDVHLKADPYGRFFEVRPGTSSITIGDSDYSWKDKPWIEERKEYNWLHQPMSIYEVHLGSWQQDENGDFLSYRELAHRLADYVKEMGYTHVELLPITEHPFDGSWGYQTIGYYAPTSRFGTPDDFRYFVDYLHQHDIGVLLDWAPGHFPKDAHGLARFDGSALYEHEDVRLGEHRDWGTLIFNYGRNEVRNFLISSAVYWLEEFHIDGLRVDAVASMLYLDYSRNEGEWVPNQYGGNENIEAIQFMRQLNEVTHEQHPGTIVMAEESTSWPMVSRPTWLGGLGFSMKWNMGWMNDTLSYMSKDPVYRHFHHGDLAFSIVYAFNENFILPFSHDEVVHGKGSLLNKMPGDSWQKFANLRLLYCYMFTHPGKKLQFMGCEFGQWSEWDYANPLDWELLQRTEHQGIKALVKDLNHIYTQTPALYDLDFDAKGFEWIDCHDSAQSVLSYLRSDENETMIIVLNYTPVPRFNYRVGVPFEGEYEEVLNTDSEYYGGSNVGNASIAQSDGVPWMNRNHSLELNLPPLGGIILKYRKEG